MAVRAAMFCGNCGSQVQIHQHIFCSNCGTRTRRNQELSTNDTDERTIISHYFTRGYRYESILEFLKIYHDIIISLSTLKRNLRQYGLHKKGVSSQTEDSIRSIIRNEINGPSSLRGYRATWNMLRSTYSITVPRDVVMKILREEDAEGTEQRRARRLSRRTYRSNGPNEIWHVDGYDKLKPYGLPIHGCVDGYSRRIIWLKLCKSNNNPVIPATFFMDALTEFGLFPCLVRTDCGTENGIMAGIQCSLANDVQAHRYGTSPSNQRIENWWSHFRRGYSGWVIDYFKEMVDDGDLVLGNNVHMEGIWYVYNIFFQAELDRIKTEWNAHFIRKSHNTTISGIPNELFLLPHISNGVQCGIDVADSLINQIIVQRDVYAESKALYNDDGELLDYFQYIVNNEGLSYPPRTWADAKSMYKIIMTISGC